MTTKPVLNTLNDFDKRMKIFVKAMDQSSEGIAIGDMNGYML
jgi:hypothetical protein